ncbi:MAG: CPBP family intramembrane glutamic endopeptidase [Candidatus Hermodarchaeota archaeon]
MAEIKLNDLSDIYKRYPYIWTLLFFLVTFLGVFFWIFGYFLAILIIFLLVDSGYSQKSSLLDYGLRKQSKSIHYLILGTILAFSLMTGIFILEIYSPLVVISGTLFDIQDFLFIFLNLGFYLGFQIIVAGSEELVYRGYILQETVHRGEAKAVAWSAFLFTVSHLPAIIFSYMEAEALGLVVWYLPIIMLGTLFFGGLFLGLGVIRTGGQLWFSIGFHFAWNYFQYTIYGLTSEGIFLLELIPGTELLTGGGLGPEAGLLGFIPIFFCFVGILVTLKRKKE